MKEKKASANWNIAATHWLTAGFVIPFLLSFLAGVPLLMVLGDNVILFYVIIILVTIFGIWGGVMYSARYLNKTYFITNAKQIILISTIYYGVIGGAIRGYKMMQVGTVMVEEIVGFLICVAVFYFASERYVKNNATIAPAPTE